MLTQSYLEDLSYKVINCIFEVHNNLGPGLLESVYQTCLMDELLSRNIPALEFPHVPIHYKGKNLGGRFQPDIFVCDGLIIELKSVEMLIPLHKAQLLTYLKLANVTKGLLVNFNSEKIKDQLHSLVLPSFFELPKN